MALLNLLLLLLGLGVPVSSIHLEKRMEGGHPCNDHERHYHVVFKANDGTHETLCGGSLISDQWFLTAAHCWKSDPGWTHIAYLGVHPKAAQIEQHVVTRHEIYNDSLGHRHDIMMVKLPNPTTITPIQRVNCPTSLPAGTVIQIAGFGPGRKGLFRQKTKEHTDLQCADIKISERRKYVQKIGEYRWYQFWDCAKSSKKRTTPGDSGGGWVYQNRLYGVHSFGIPGWFYCQKASGFLEVCAYERWINDVIIT